MTQCRAIDVAIAAVALLNSSAAQAVFAPLAPTAVRCYRPQYDLAKGGLAVWVVAKSLETSPFGRGIVEELVGLDVGVEVKVPELAATTPTLAAADCAAVDPYMLLMQQIKQQLEAPNALSLADAPADCGWQGTTNDPIYDAAELQHNAHFFSVATFQFLTRRSR